MSHSGVINHDQTEPYMPSIWLTAVVTVVLLAVTILFSIFYFDTTVSEEKNLKEDTGVSLSVSRKRAYESEQLTSFKWTDKNAGLVQVPLAVAKELVIKAHAR